MSKIEHLKRNHLLAAIRPEALVYISIHAQIRALSAGDAVYAQEDEFQSAVFPLSCVMSFMIQDDDVSVESANVGREGFVGAALLFTDRLALSNSAIQVPGDAAFVSMDALKAGFEAHACIREAVFLYSQRFIGELMRTIACVRMHSADQRVALWLLRAFDRIEGASIEITHRSLASALGQRRATVTDACARLQRVGAIETGRGRITVLDPAGLEAACCGCYGRLRALHAPIDLPSNRRGEARSDVEPPA